MIQLKNMIDPFIDRSLYVWGGQGENVCVQRVGGTLDPEGWIRTKETSAANADRAITLYRKRIADLIDPVYCFDCSGFICEVLTACGILKPGTDLNTKGLYRLCNSHPTPEELRVGDLVFYSKTGDANDIVHVGFYWGDGQVCECRGRDYGVVVTEFNDNPANWEHPWNMFGRIDKLEPFTVDEPEPEPEYPDKPMSLEVCKPVESGDAYALLQAALNFLGYTDNEGNPLVIDGKWGKRSRQAWDKAVTYNLGTISVDVSLHIDGVCTKEYALKEE